MHCMKSALCRHGMVAQSSRWTNGLERFYCSKVSERQKEMMSRSLPKQMRLPGVEHVVVVASGKGGVGKSTTSVNLAVSLAQKGKRVGLLDGDVFGPTIPLMMNLDDTPLLTKENLMIPLQNFGVKCMSMGFLIEPNKPIIWRGPLVMSAIQRLLKGTQWSPLDILIVDTPPGTGDLHLSLAQNVPISGVILVSTPQRAALDVTIRGADMYKTLKVPLIGIIENMSHVTCTKCNERIELYPRLIEQMAKEWQLELLQSVPIDPQLCECADTGTPIVIKHPESPLTRTYDEIADKILKFLVMQSEKTAA